MQKLVAEQAKILKRLEEERLAEEKRKEAEAETARKEAEKLKAEKEKLKAEAAAALEREQLLQEKKQKFKSATDTEKVFDTRGQAGMVSYDDLINAFIARIEAIAKTTFGLEFLRELVNRGELNYEKSMSFYLTETRVAQKQGLAKRIKKEVQKKGKTQKEEYLIYDFNYMLTKVIESMGLREPDYVDEGRLRKKFEQLVKKANRNNFLERIILGEPFLEF
jgi:hypothetical protein